MLVGEGGDGDSDADSELSVLASSLFDGIDGIEYSGICGIEAGGSIKQGSDGDGDNDSTSAPVIAFSPQKMRSGKVVRYHSEE